MITYITSLSTLDELICYSNHLGRNSEQTAEYPSTSFYKHSCSILVVTLPVVRNPSTASWLNACDLQYLFGELEQPRMISIHIQISSNIYVHHNKHAQTSPKKHTESKYLAPFWCAIFTAIHLVHHRNRPCRASCIHGIHCWNVVGCGRSWVRGRRRSSGVSVRTRTEQTIGWDQKFCLHRKISHFFSTRLQNFHHFIYKKVENISMAINTLNQIHVYIMNINYKNYYLYK